MPLTSVVFCAPGKNALLSNDGGVGSRAPRPANSPIHVVPTIAASGVLSAVMAVVNLSWAESHGIAVMLTLAPGLALSNFLASAGSFSPSAPIAHTVIVPLALPPLTSLAWSPEAAAPVSRPQADRASAAVVSVATVIAELRLIVVLLLVGIQACGNRTGGSGSDGVRVAGARRGLLTGGWWAATRRAQHQLRGQDLQPVVGGGAGDQLVQPVRGHRAEVPHRLTDRGQARADVAGRHHVVPADDGDVAGNVRAALLQPRHDRQGELVVGAHQGVGVDLSGEDALGEPGAVRLPEGDPQRIGRRLAEAAVVGLREPQVAVADIRAGAGGADEQQPAPAMVQHVQRQGTGAGGVLRADRLHAIAGVPGDEQQRLGSLQRPD